MKDFNQSTALGHAVKLFHQQVNWFLETQWEHARLLFCGHCPVGLWWSEIFRQEHDFKAVTKATSIIIVDTHDLYGNKVVADMYWDTSPRLVHSPIDLGTRRCPCLSPPLHALDPLLRQPGCGQGVYIRMSTQSGFVVGCDVRHLMDVHRLWWRKVWIESRLEVPHDSVQRDLFPVTM